MRILACAALLLTASAPPFAAEPQVAFNNLAHEFTTCAAYFGVVSIAIENSNDPETAAEYATLMERSLTYAFTTARGIGLLDETTESRFGIAMDEMQERIGGNTSNISILFADHMDTCTAAMEDPEGRIAYWLAK